MIGLAWKSRHDLIWVDAVGLVEETREGETGCGLDPDEESGGGEEEDWWIGQDRLGFDWLFIVLDFWLGTI